jgi:hypothetical protein
MQYLVREASGQSMIFKTLPDVIKHFQKTNNAKQLLIGEGEGGLTQLEGHLKERLATISLHTAFNKKKQWTITAFE